MFKKPRLSIIVIVYKMPEQAKNTLHSLSLAYQQGVLPTDYEIVVVENKSNKVMGLEFLENLAGNFRHYLRQETRPTPVYAINFGVKKTKGKLITLMIDGARMAIPCMIKTILQASKIGKNTVVAVPGYHLGKTVQQKAINTGYNEVVETALFESIQWKNNGYRLFEPGCFSASSRPDFLSPCQKVIALVSLVIFEILPAE
jgi:glycosyltransferase involved in cell wall biosynthesis